MRRSVFGFLVLLGACGGGEKAALPEASEGQALLGVRVVAPQEKLQQSLMRVTGVLRAKNDAVLSAPASGTVAKVLVEVGDKVREGQTLVVFDTSDVNILVQQATAARDMASAGLDAANLELERAKQLRATDAAPPAILDRAIAAQRQAKAGLDQATAALHMAEENLRDHSLRAPFNGVVTQRFKNLGETVAMMPPTPVIAVVAAEDLEVRLPMPETVVDFIQKGLVGKGRVSPSGVAFEATVTSVGAMVDPQNRTIEVLAKVTSPLTRQMRPGALVDLDFSEVAGDVKVAGLFLPTQAVRSAGERRFVFVVKGDTVEERDVKIEAVTPGVVRVDGVTKEEQVVVEGAQGLKSGARVHVAES